MSRISFRRYTTLPLLLDILHNRRIALLDPATWEDTNDAYFMSIYKEKKDFKTLLALCFAEAPEKYQHWKIYSGNISGVCVEFNKYNLLGKISNNEAYRYKKIDYKNLAILKDYKPTVDELPFIKRVSFEDEEEFRIIYTNETKVIKINYIEIDPGDIVRIIINPWINQNVFDSVVSVLRKIDGFDGIKVKHSGVLNKEKWKNIGDNAIAEEREKRDDAGTT